MSEFDPKDIESVNSILATHAMHNELTALRDQVRVLREALREIAQGRVPSEDSEPLNKAIENFDQCAFQTALAVWLQQRARAALAQTEPKP